MPRAVDGQRMRHSIKQRRPLSRRYNHTYRRHAELHRCANEREAAGARKGPEHRVPRTTRCSIAHQTPFANISHSSLTVTRKLFSASSVSNTPRSNAIPSPAISSASSAMPALATTFTASASVPRSPLPWP